MSKFRDTFLRETQVFLQLALLIFEHFSDRNPLPSPILKCWNRILRHGILLSKANFHLPDSVTRILTIKSATLDCEFVFIVFRVEV